MLVERTVERVPLILVQQSLFGFLVIRAVAVVWRKVVLLVLTSISLEGISEYWVDKRYCHAACRANHGRDNGQVQFLLHPGKP